MYIMWQIMTIFFLGETPNALVNYRALYPFEARNHDEMSFNSGDIIQVGKKRLFFFSGK